MVQQNKGCNTISALHDIALGKLKPCSLMCEHQKDAPFYCSVLRCTEIASILTVARKTAHPSGQEEVKLSLSCA